MNDPLLAEEKLIKELNKLQLENNSLKALLNKDNAERNNTEVALLEANSKLKLAMNGGNMAWWKMDVVSGGVTFDKLKVEMLGYKPENFKHYKDFTALVHPEDFNRIMKAMKGHFEGLFDKYEAEYRILTNTGEYIWFFDYGSVVKRDSNGKPLICTGFVYNITARKNAEEVLRKSEQMLHTVLDNFPGLVFWKDRQSNYIGCNQSFASGAGLKSSAEIIGLSDFNLPWGPIEGERYRTDDLNVMENGKEKLHIIEMQHQTNDRIIWLDTSKIPLRDQLGQVVGVIGVSTDISLLKTTEQELINANNELTLQNEEKSKHAEELIIALEKAEESDRLKSAFLANISHEIRTPMNGILGFSGLLKEQDLTGEEQQEFLGIIEKSGVRMLNIINDIVDISKIESGQMKISISEININELNEFILTFFRPESEQKGLQIAVKNTLSSIKAIIKTDREKVYAILSNLVGNSIKYTTSGFIEFGYTKKKNYLEFYVKDTGIGITMKQKEIIFKRFRQGSESTNRKYQGAGLGLSIAKSYVEMLGGKIWVDSVVGKGSIFYFTLPYHRGY